MVQELLQELKDQGVQLVAVSKRKTPEAIMALYHMGHRAFGENRVQELEEKYEQMVKDIEWHFIGHLQTNKVKYIAPYIHLIHSLDSIKVMREVNKQAKKNERIIPGLLQFKIAEEDTKYGLTPDEILPFLKSEAFQNLDHLAIHGVMGMATFTDDEQQVRTEFRRLKHIFDTLQKEVFSDQPSFKEISMGMSGDYPIAIEEGSTMVRIGSLIFGPRD
jgi:pyridoxal phosphate enzyme (YggS family)